MRKLRLRTRVAIVAIILMLAIPMAMSAQGRDGVGLGVIVGQPTGLSAISWLGGGNALDFVAAWSFQDSGSFYVHADYQFHGYVDRPMTLFSGLGGFVLLQDDPALGIRIPLGVSFLFQRAPLDLFFEVAPGMTLAPSTDFFIGGGVGLRFYF
ncbi:MAG: hypothetical protein ACOC2Q_01075 [Spirochaetota bacterium]